MCKMCLKSVALSTANSVLPCGLFTTLNSYMPTIHINYTTVSNAIFTIININYDQFPHVLKWLEKSSTFQPQPLVVINT